MRRWLEPVNWKRLLVSAVVAMVGTYVGFLILTSILAVQLFGGMAETWARMYLMICQWDGKLPAECAADPSLRWGFTIGMGLLFSIAAVPCVVFLRERLD